jgi:hypothetical protein
MKPNQRVPAQRGPAGTFLAATGSRVFEFRCGHLDVTEHQPQRAGIRRVSDYVSFRPWNRFRDMPWQRIVRRGLAPSTVGLVIADGYVMARTGDTGWPAAAITAAAVLLMLATRFNPLWIPAAGGVAGGPGLL